MSVFISEARDSFASSLRVLFSDRGLRFWRVFLRSCLRCWIARFHGLLAFSNWIRKEENVVVVINGL